MVEIEIGVLRGQYLDRRIDDPKILIPQIAAWERQRNAAGARIKWMFNRQGPRQNEPRLSRNDQRVIITVKRY